MEMKAEQPAIVFLNMTGDVTIGWTEENQDAILALVAEKMKEGYSFFILKPRWLGLGTKRVKAKSIDEISAAGSVVVDDANFTRMMKRLGDPAVEAVVAQGQAHLVQANHPVEEMGRLAKTPEEVVQHQTVAVRRVVGG